MAFLWILKKNSPPSLNMFLEDLGFLASTPYQLILEKKIPVCVKMKIKGLFTDEYCLHHTVVPFYRLFHWKDV